MIYLCVFESNSAPAAALVERWASTEDREYAARRKNPLARQNSLLARAVLRRLLAINHNSEARILYTQRGKPYIENGPYISISHSADMVFCGVCDEFPFGLDIEFHKKRDFARLADYVFGKAEISAAEQGGDIEFYRIWTMREAIAKCAGESVFSKMNGDDIDLRRWRLFYRNYCKDYSVALAAENPGEPLEGLIMWVDATA